MGTLTKEQEVLRRLPSVEVLAQRAVGLTHEQAVAAARHVIAEVRRRKLRGEDVDLSAVALDAALAKHAAELLTSSLRPVINATGVILHTNLGRAPLAPAAAEAAALAGASYTNLEYDLADGQRGSRQSHLGPALRELSGAEDALAVNNNAAGVLLALASLGSGEVIVSRGELIEIGGSFRIPDILAQSGSTLVEIGTTNRTRIGDYERAIGSRTVGLLRVHQSNFRIEGFAEQPALDQMCRLGAEHGLPVIDDLGSGALEPIYEEPTLAASVEAGVTLVCCSADKLLGGPQAGLIFGAAEVVERCRRHPLARALRLDKMQLAALEVTLRLWRTEGARSIPVPRMLAASGEDLERKADRLVQLAGSGAQVIPGAALPGGGSLPDVELDGPVCALEPGLDGADALAAALRAGEPPVIARISEGRVLLDPRSIDDADIALVGAAAASALADR